MNVLQNQKTLGDRKYGRLKRILIIAGPNGAGKTTTALRRAAVKARRRAIETTGSVPVWKDRKIVYETEV